MGEDLDMFVGIDGTTPDLFWNQYFAPFDLAMSFVRLLHKHSVAEPRFRYHYAGPDEGGFGTSACVSEPLDHLSRYIYVAKRRHMTPRITIVGYSRGAYAAIRVAQGLGRMGVRVHFLGLIDTVKVTITGVETAIGQVIDKYDDGFDTYMEAKRQADEVALRMSSVYPRPSGNYMMVPPSAETLRSSVADAYGRRLENEIYVADPADRRRGSGNYIDDVGHFVVPGNVEYAIHLQRDPSAGSWRNVMGCAPVERGLERTQFDCPPRLFCTHSAMGGMPFRGDMPSRKITRASEWAATAKVASILKRTGEAHGVIRGFEHPTLRSTTPPHWWLLDPNIEQPYVEWSQTNGYDGLEPEQDRRLRTTKLMMKAMTGSP